MSVVRPIKGLALSLVLIAAGCGPSGTTASGPSLAPLVPAVGRTTAVVADSQTPTASAAPGTAVGTTASSQPDFLDSPSTLPVPSAIGGTTPTPTAEATGSSPDPTTVASAIPLAASSKSARPGSRDSLKLARAAQDSPFHQFGDDVYTWDDRGRIVVLAVPVDHPSLDQIREIGGHKDGAIEDTAGTRAWVQQCARQQADDALDSPDAVYGAVTAQAVYDCLGGLVHLADLFARYWWTEAGVSCLAQAVTAYSLHGDNRPRPLAVCPSIGYDPAAPRPPGWMAQRCAEIAAVNPNPAYPTGPVQPGEPLPSCWAPLLATIESHAAESVESGFPDSPHDCYHALLGFVWARQTGRESRPPSDLAIGCHYRAFEAKP